VASTILKEPLIHLSITVIIKAIADLVDRTTIWTIIHDTVAIIINAIANVDDDARSPFFNAFSSTRMPTLIDTFFFSERLTLVRRAISKLRRINAHGVLLQAISLGVRSDVLDCMAGLVRIKVRGNRKTTGLERTDRVSVMFQTLR
tara:strand:- start:47 stop:484 length:438 start_codon:yes stop_codon:yes gene_type:complete